MSYNDEESTATFSAEVKLEEACVACHGSGLYRGTTIPGCPSCGGKGSVFTTDGEAMANFIRKVMRLDSQNLQMMQATAQECMNTAFKKANNE